jgi:hypothetical protein
VADDVFILTQKDRRSLAECRTADEVLEVLGLKFVLQSMSDGTERVVQFRQRVTDNPRSAEDLHD